MISRYDNVETAQELLRRIADEVTLVVWESDIGGRCLYLNPACQNGRAKLPEFSILDWLQFVHPEDLAHVIQAVEGARKKQTEYRSEYRIVCSNGSVRWIMSTAAPRFAADGCPIGYVGTLVDITELQETRARLMRSEAEHRLLT